MNNRETKKYLQNKQTDSNQMAFIKDTNFNYLLSKTEKICTALYMVADLFDKSEPLKFSIKDKSLSLIDSVVDLVGSYDTLRAADLAGLDTLEVRSLLTLSYRAGLVSDMNYQIIRAEIDNIIDLLKEIKISSDRNTDDLFSSEFFAVDPVRNAVVDQKTLFKDRFAKSNRTYVSDQYVKDIDKGQNINNVLYNNNNDRYIKTIESYRPKVNKKKDNSERRSKILDIIKTKKKVSVKDISTEMSDVSEKTLQRELLSMVKDKVIKKEGERRWSRYFL